MKKIITACFYLILTSVVIAIVFFLPSTLFTYEDQQLLAKVEQTEIESVEFTYSYSLFDTLKLIASGFYTVEYPSSGATRTADEIYKITKDAFAKLNHYGEKKGIFFLQPNDKIVDYATSLQLAISNNYETNFISSDHNADDNPSSYAAEDTALSESSTTGNSQAAGITSATIWRCHLYTESGYLAEFRIDDKSGKIVGLFLWTNQENLANKRIWSTKALLDTIRSFLKDYYGLKAKIIPQDKTSTTDTDISQASSGSTSDPNYKTRQISAYSTTYIIRLTNEFGHSAQIPVKIAPEWIDLN